jgi:hypothetical protein
MVLTMNAGATPVMHCRLTIDKQMTLVLCKVNHERV